MIQNLYKVAKSSTYLDSNTYWEFMESLDSKNEELIEHASLNVSCIISTKSIIEFMKRKRT
jgi:hypothetical protein